MTYSIHEVPGRIRIRTPNIKDHPLKAQAVQVYLRALVGVEEIEVNVSTGSISVRFDATRLRTETILEVLSKRGCLAPMFFDSQLQLLSRKVSITSEKDKTIITHLLTAVMPTPQLP